VPRAREGIVWAVPIFLSAALYLAAGPTVSGLDFRQEPRKLRFGRIAIDIAEAVAVARANPAILAVPNC
jgi:hypothetical protein